MSVDNSVKVEVCDATEPSIELLMLVTESFNFIKELIAIRDFLLPKFPQRGQRLNTFDTPVYSLIVLWQS